MPCGLVGLYQLFGRIYYLHLLPTKRWGERRGIRNRGITVELTIYTLTKLKKATKLVIQIHKQKIHRLELCEE